MKINRKKILILLSVVVIIAAAALLVPMFLTSDDAEEEGAKVYREGTTIVYDGPMDEEAVKKVKTLYDKDITRLVLNSQGGEINIGMDLGTFVFDNKLDVEVTKYAFSSAANYVFPAGNHKYLHKESMVGWHGGATQKDSNFFMRLIMKKYIEESSQREKDFFKKIGVNQESTVYGQRPEFDEYKDYVGWTYSLDAMEQLGIKNIELIDGEWTPPDNFEGKKIFTVEKIDQNA